jgi:mRNA-degrading endonuclease toxin of MazEF toxin-antitoxin module
VVNLDHLQTIDQRRLLNRIASLTAERLQQVDAAIHVALGLGDRHPEG